MEEIIILYKKLLSCLEEEQTQIGACLQGDILCMYQELLEYEKQTITNNLRELY